MGVDIIKLSLFFILSFVMAHFYLRMLKGAIKKERYGREDQKGVHRYSFPSYHTGIGTTLCLVQAISLPESAPFMVAFVILTAYSRVKLDRHDYSDVVSAIMFVIPLVFLSYLFLDILFNMVY